MNQLPRFKISSSDKPFTLALEVETALVECAVNKFVSIPAETKIPDAGLIMYQEEVVYFTMLVLPVDMTLWHVLQKVVDFAGRYKISSDQGGLPFL